ncbi:MAG: hypothetical protein ACFE9P_00110 [Candidatus Hermodarchaeota archaeon]
MEDFKDNQVLESVVGKLNKYLNKNKDEKINKIINDLKILLEEEDNQILITYIFSVLAENNFKYISDDLLEKVQEFLNSPELKLNSLIILGFGMIYNSIYLEKYLCFFIQALTEKNSDIRSNVHYFLQEIVKVNPQILCTYKENILNALLIEESNANLYSLLDFLSNCENFYFSDIFWFKQIIKRISLNLRGKCEAILYNKLFELCRKFFDPLKDVNYEKEDLNKLYELIDSIVILKKYNLTGLRKQSNIRLKTLIDKIRRSRFKDEEVYFYTKNKENDEVYIYEFEKIKLINFFEQNKKISRQLIKDFLYIIESDHELELVIKTLIKLNIINGYFSELGYFYPYNYLRDQFEKVIKKDGILNIQKFDYLPINLLKKILKEISFSTKKKFLVGKTRSIFYSLKTITKEINSNAAKHITVDLKSYRETLTEKSFINLIKNLPKDYLTNYRKGTILLTNLGLLKIENEIKNSKILGYLSIPKISEKLDIDKVLLVDVLDKFVDPRSGLFNNDKEIFYYSRYINEKIENINQVNDIKEKEVKVIELTRELNIQKEIILRKIDENLNLIGDEIKNQDQINIREYLEKTGMDESAFFNFINNLELKYLKKGDTLIFNEYKIKEAEKEIRNMLMEKSETQDYILLGDIDTTSSSAKNLLSEMQDNEEIKGIFYDDDDEVKFYTKNGIEKLILQNSYNFSFKDLFYGKELSEKDLELLCSITENLISKGKLKGTFDKESLTFSSFGVLFNQDYNVVLDEFERMVKNYNRLFDSEFQLIKKILTKDNTTIFPQEIKEVQESIDRINEQYVRWRSGLEAFIRKANIQLLKKQGYTMKKYKNMILSPQRKEDVRLFEDDPEVQDYLNQFMSWIKRFNNIELRYGNVIFYQKRLIKDPNNSENKKILDDLLHQLNLY